MIQGTGSVSLRKQDLENQKIPATGFIKTAFAHKATAGDTGITLTSLSLPTEMSANGFSNPPTAQITNAQILFYKNNLTLTSSLRGLLQQGLAYTVASSTRLNFVGFTAVDGEIFTGTIDYSAMTGLKVVDARPINATGTLAATTTDFNVGTPYKVNQYSTTQIGAVMVFLDGVIQFRNSGNSSVTLDGNYYEVDAGAGLGTIIRFNTTDPVNARNVLVVSNGLLSERPDGSMMATIESIQGQVNNMAGYVASAVGQTTTTVLGGAPSNVDLKAFGDRVLTLEQNRARIDQGNTWTAAQALVGRIDGTNPSNGQIGEELKQTRLQSANISLTASDASSNVTATSLSLTPGVWEISGEVAFDTNATTETVFRAGISNSTGAGSATFSGGDTIGVADNLGQKRAQLTVSAVTSSSSITLPINPYRYSVSASQTMFLVASATYTGTAPKVYGTIRAVRIA